MDITNKMLDIMQEKGIKASELAAGLNINRSVISAWKKRGTNPPAEYLVQICKLLDITIYELLNIDSEFTNEERQIINAYRKLDKDSKEAFKTLLHVRNNTGKSSITKIG